MDTCTLNTCTLNTFCWHEHLNVLWLKLCWLGTLPYGRIITLRIRWLHPLLRHKNPHQKRCPRYDIKLHLIVRLQFWREESIGITPRTTQPFLILKYLSCQMKISGCFIITFIIWTNILISGWGFLQRFSLYILCPFPAIFYIRWYLNVYLTSSIFKNLSKNSKTWLQNYVLFSCKIFVREFVILQTIF